MKAKSEHGRVAQHARTVWRGGRETSREALRYVVSTAQILLRRTTSATARAPAATSPDDDGRAEAALALERCTAAARTRRGCSGRAPRLPARPCARVRAGGGGPGGSGGAPGGGGGPAADHSPPPMPHQMLTRTLFRWRPPRQGRPAGTLRRQHAGHAHAPPHDRAGRHRRRPSPCRPPPDPDVASRRSTSVHEARPARRWRSRTQRRWTRRRPGGGAPPPPPPPPPRTTSPPPRRRAPAPGRTPAAHAPVRERVPRTPSAGSRRWARPTPTSAQRAGAPAARARTAPGGPVRSRPGPVPPVAGKDPDRKDTVRGVRIRRHRAPQRGRGGGVLRAVFAARRSSSRTRRPPRFFRSSFFRVSASSARPRSRASSRDRIPSVHGTSGHRTERAWDRRGRTPRDPLLGPGSRPPGVPAPGPAHRGLCRGVAHQRRPRELARGAGGHPRARVRRAPSAPPPPGPGTRGAPGPGWFRSVPCRSPPEASRRRRSASCSATTRSSSAWNASRSTSRSSSGGASPGAWLGSPRRLARAPAARPEAARRARPPRPRGP